MPTRFAAVLLTYGAEPSPDSTDGTALTAARVSELVQNGVRVHVSDVDQVREVMRALGFTEDWIEFRISMA